MFNKIRNGFRMTYRTKKMKQLKEVRTNKTSFKDEFDRTCLNDGIP